MAADLLIVDDDPFIRKLVATTLRGVGTLNLHEAADGAAAVEAAAGLELRLVLLDIDMPRLDGIETCRRLRATAGGSDTTIVMLTASDDDSAEQRAVAAGADRFLRKPFSPLELLELVDELSGPEPPLDAA